MTDDRFDEFYLFEYQRLVAALRFVTGDRDLARDSVDEACARAVERLARGQKIDVLGAWIRVVARNVARGRLRRLRSERHARQQLAAAAATQREIAGDVAAVMDVHVALAALSRRQREVVVLYYFFGHSVEEVAAELGIAAGTVKAALHHARAALAQSLADTGVEKAQEQS